MSTTSNPRLLVVDDDLGVIAAYRHVLEGSELDRARRDMKHADMLESELFGQSSPEDRVEPEWRVHFVDQGLDAVEAVKESINNSDPFSVIFLDIRMPPGLDGYETAQLIRGIDPVVHIVFVSAYSDYSDDELLQVAGPVGRTSFMPKPVWPDELKAVALERSKESRLRSLMNEASRLRGQSR